MTEQETYTYWTSTRNMVEIGPEELEQVKQSYCPYLLKWLWMREMAYHNSWVKEPAMRHAALKTRCNAYRDQARKIAFAFAMDWAVRSGFIGEINIENQGSPGPNATLYQLTSRGKAWIIQYDNNHRAEHGRTYVTPPTKDQFINDLGYDKDNMPQKEQRKIKERRAALKAKAAKKKPAKKKAARKKAPKKKASRRTKA